MKGNNTSNVTVTSRKIQKAIFVIALIIFGIILGVVISRFSNWGDNSDSFENVPLPIEEPFEEDVTTEESTTEIIVIRDDEEPSEEEGWVLVGTWEDEGEWIPGVPPTTESSTEIEVPTTEDEDVTTEVPSTEESTTEESTTETPSTEDVTTEESTTEEIPEDVVIDIQVEAYNRAMYYHQYLLDCGFTQLQGVNYYIIGDVATFYGVQHGCEYSYYVEEYVGDDGNIYQRTFDFEGITIDLSK